MHPLLLITVLSSNLFSGTVDPNSTKTNDVPDTPIFRYNSTRNFFSSIPTFQASLNLESRNSTKLDVSLINYPFDQ